MNGGNKKNGVQQWLIKHVGASMVVVGLIPGSNCLSYRTDNPFRKSVTLHSRVRCNPFKKDTA
jgi:hypothetical protein